ncbi:glycosyltransferase family 4 protein [Actinomyces sp. MRS3W]|uniref:glycosyltransferase family 4 protein n=1 Tax=Actinomyces sp. MRS3W TaxID=2800796 RepID=UPI0028FD91B7|nr:glycosyltransferase family 4 protein [Actinomyces sp. MRS3W]MDU0347381.1 glycosyltransferase family 4 protein [Actinomyces sp. MRS3W]
MAMRILLLTHYWSPEVGAPQKRWQWLARDLVERGHELAVLAPAPHYPAGRLLDADPRYAPGAVARDASGAMIHRTAFRPYDAGLGGRGADQAVAAGSALRLGMQRFRGRWRPDVVVGSVPGLPTLPAALALGRALDRPVVAELRDAWPDILGSAASWVGAPAPRSMRRRVIHAARRAVPPVVTGLEREADAVVTTTDSFATVLRERGMRRVVTVRNTARADGWELPPVPAARADGALHVLYLGTVGRAQGMVSAVRAAAAATASGTPMVLRIVGDGAQIEAVRAEAARLGAPVEVLSPVPMEQVAAHYAWADTVLVSLQDWPAMSVTVPSKLYEILATGRHASGAVTGEAAAILREAGAGDVVAPQHPQALAALWGELARDRRRLAPTGGGRWLKEHVREEDLVSRYESLLAEVAGA